LRTTACCCLIFGLIGGRTARAGQEDLNEEPPPANAKDVTTPMEDTFIPEPEPPPNAVSEDLNKKLESLAPFIRDTEVILKLRTYYFDSEKPGGKESEAWAGGGSIWYRSGWAADHVRIGAELFTSQPIYAPADKDGTLLLAPGQEGYTVLGQAYAQLRIIGDNTLTLGRSEYNMPYVNRQFNRMTPNTFQGGSLAGSFGLPQENKFKYLLGYLSDIKPRNSDEFIPMSQQLGPAATYYGTYIGELLWSHQTVSAGISDYYTQQNLNIFYGELNWSPEALAAYGVKLSAQYSDQKAIGGALSLNNALGHSNAGIRGTFGFGGAVFELAYSVTSDDGDLLNPWGSNPSYTNALITNRNRSGERGFLAGASYNFGKLNVPGLTASAVWADGWSAKRPGTDTPAPDQHELDLTLDYKVQKGIFKGLWFRLQRLRLQAQNEDDATKEWRVILNWEIPLLTGK
jgi:hypothetical protein